MKIEVKRKNLNWTKKFTERLKTQTDKEVAVGMPVGKDLGASHYSTGASLLEVFIWFNFGTEKTPRRPVVEMSNPEIQSMYKKLAKDLAPRVEGGKISAETVLMSAGRSATAIMQNTLRNFPWEPNSPETIKRKKSEKPGIDTGDMLKAITFDVRKRTRK